MSADTELRAAYRALADSAPSLDTLTIPGSATARWTATRRVRGQRLAVVATVAVIALIVGALVVAGQRRHRSEPAAPPADPAYSWQFGPHSLPGYVPTEREISADVTTYDYAQIPTNISRQTPGGRAVLTTLVPDAAARSAVAALARTTVGGKPGWYGRLTSAAACTALRLSTMYCPGSVTVWTDAIAQRWVVFQAAPKMGRLVTPLETLPPEQVLALAGKVRVEAAGNVAAVRVGYVPPAMKLTSAHELVAVQGGGSGKGNTLDLFFAAPTGDATVHLQVTPQEAIDLNSTTAAEISAGYILGTWIKTKVDGRTAWHTSDTVLMQFGKTIVEIDNVSEAGGTGHDSTTPLTELIKVAASLSHVVPVDSGDASTLPEAIPPGALW